MKGMGIFLLVFAIFSMVISVVAIIIVLQDIAEEKRWRLIAENPHTAAPVPVVSGGVAFRLDEDGLWRGKCPACGKNLVFDRLDFQTKCRYCNSKLTDFYQKKS